ncbi:hypothetical protein U9M48_001067 [Paspalum notatum var. saurae]|uniref:Uncharacterized protein n=1 Tax=Paspalum notatum var. saurae TaxID=547442 RepID=A0AAQ3PHR4_PASNO
MPRGESAMAAGDTATVFLETSLGTRLVVSFPARATTVADLKRQVSAEHAACFRSIGPIAVTSLQVKLDGSWFQLTDSMAVQAAFEWVKGPWRLLVEAHALRPCPVARKDAKCGTDDGEPNAGHPVIADYSSQYMLPPAEALGVGNHAPGNAISDSPQMENQQGKAQEGCEHSSDQCEDGITMSQESPDLDLASGGSDTPPMDQEDKSHEGAEHASGQQLEDGVAMAQEHSDSGLAAGDSDTPQQDKSHEDVEHASGQLEDGITMPQECSDSDLAAGNSDTLMNQQDKSHEGVGNASGQGEDRTTKPQQSSDLGVATDKGNGPVGSQQKDIIAEPRGKKRFREEETSDLGVAADKGNDPVGSQQIDIMAEPRGKKLCREEDKADESILLNCDYNLTPFASSTLKVVPEQKSSVTEQAKSNNVPLLYNLEDCSHGLRKKHSGGQKEAWKSSVCNGENSNNRSNILPCVESMERHKSSDKEVQAQRGDKEEPQIVGCAGKISCKRTDVPHCVESMKEDDKGPTSNGHYFDKGKNEGSTSTNSNGHEPCFRTSRQRLAVRKVPMSRATKTYAVR